MQSAQVEALRNGDGFLFTEQIAETAAVIEQAKYAVIEHQETHG